MRGLAGGPTVVAVGERCQVSLTDGHMRALLQRDSPHNGGGAVVAQAHQPLGQALTCIQAACLWKGGWGGVGGHQSMRCVLHPNLPKADNQRRRATNACSGGIHVQWAGAGGCRVASAAEAAEHTQPSPTPGTPTPRACTRAWPACGPPLPPTAPHLLRHRHDGQPCPQVARRGFGPLPQQVVGGHAAVLISQLLQALQAPTEVAALVVGHSAQQGGVWAEGWGMQGAWEAYKPGHRSAGVAGRRRAEQHQ